MKNLIYAVRTSNGDYEDRHESILFATLSEDYAKKYAEKYNRILRLAKDFYCEKCPMGWNRPDNSDELHEINKDFYWKAVEAHRSNGARVISFPIR